jgi:hypothetical protein
MFYMGARPDSPARDRATLDLAPTPAIRGARNSRP